MPPAPPDRVSFAMGCLVFEVAVPHRNRTWQFAEWRDEVRRALEQMPNVGNVAVSVDSPRVPRLRTDWTPYPPIDPETRPEYQHFEPTLLDTFVSFDIEIPRRMHKELLWDGSEVPCEKYRVQTVYEYHGPCTIVTALEPTPNVSDGIILVREFLQRELPKHSEQLTLTTVGPTPFHAHCTLVAREDDDEGFTARTLSRVGYRRIEFSYAKSDFANAEEASFALFPLLARELSEFYALVRYKNLTHRSEGYVARETQKLIESHKETGLRAGFRRVFRSGSDVRRMGLEILDVKLENAMARAVGLDAIANLNRQTNLIHALSEELTEYLTPEESPAVENYLEVVRFLEGGRSKEFEVAVVGASTLLGGVAGAIAALIAR